MISLQNNQRELEDRRAKLLLLPLYLACLIVWGEERVSDPGLYRPPRPSEHAFIDRVVHTTGRVPHAFLQRGKE